MTKLEPKLVIFDMDGTMIDTEFLSCQGMINAAKDQGFEFPEGLFEQMIGRSQAFARSLVREKVGEDFDFDRGMYVHQEYIDNYFEKHGAPIKKGLFELLDKLEELGIKKCVATSTDKERATHKLGKAGIVHRFEVIVGGDEVEESKPNPEIFLKAAAYCGVAPKDSLVLEDSPAGGLGAYNAGMPFILIPDMAILNGDILSKSSHVCKDLIEVAELL